MSAANKPKMRRRNITIRAMAWVPGAMHELVDRYECETGIRLTQGQLFEKLIIDAFRDDMPEFEELMRRE